MNLLVPMRFRFVEPDDVAAYGGDWTVYDEKRILRMPVGELAALEAEIGMSVLSMMRGFRTDHVMASLAVTWVARRVTGADVPRFEKFTPLILLAEWERAPTPDAPEADPAPLDSSSSESPGEASPA